jgi:hypothetical protein
MPTDEAWEQAKAEHRALAHDGAPQECTQRRCQLEFRLHMARREAEILVEER